MKSVRIAIIIVGILFPYIINILAFLIRKTSTSLSNFIFDLALTRDTMRQIIMTESIPSTLKYFALSDALLLLVTQFICWGPILFLTLTYRYSLSCLFPALGGFGYLFYAYVLLNFDSDPQSPLVYLFAPIYSVPFIIIGWTVGLCVDRFLLKPRPQK